LTLRAVERNILTILRERRNECFFNNPYPSQQEENCRKIMDDYTEAETNYYIKCKPAHSFLIDPSSSSLSNFFSTLDCSVLLSSVLSPYVVRFRLRWRPRCLRRCPLVSG
jgi:hypothetical protein